MEQNLPPLPLVIFENGLYYELRCEQYYCSMKKFDNYRKNLAVLRRSDQQDLSNEFVISGIIDKFSIQFELGWKILKKLLTYGGR